LISGFQNGIFQNDHPIREEQNDMNCHSCGKEIQPAGKIGRQEPCPKCGAILHCCLNCRFFSEPAHHQCREEQAEFVNDKSGANFCDFFEPAGTRSAKTDAQRDLARKKLEDLFKK
jgi:predicted RNA-binding Zn-ribbon protein involved in translation (DUF1610 family)